MVESYHYVFISSEDDFTKFGANLIIALPPGIALKFITLKYLWSIVILHFSDQN